MRPMVLLVRSIFQNHILSSSHMIAGAPAAYTRESRDHTTPHRCMYLYPSRRVAKSIPAFYSSTSFVTTMKMPVIQLKITSCEIVRKL